MFKLHRHRSDKLGDKVEFRFSNLQAFKIPQGWDKLVLSIVSVESGKVVLKSAKATVRCGTCQWTDSESIWVSQDEASNKLEESQFKIVISMGSARSGILGEVFFNLADYLSSEDSDPLLLPLDHCEFGSALQVQIRCFGARSKFRFGKSLKEKTSHLEDPSSNNDDIDNKLGGSNHILIGSTSSNQLGSTLPDEHGNMDTTKSTLGSHHSSGSGDDSFRKSSLNGGAYVGCQDSAGSHVIDNSATGAGEELSRSSLSSFNARASGSSFNTNQREEISSQASHDRLASVDLGSSDSSKVLLEAVEELEELHHEVKMWEQHAQQMKVDIDSLKKELSEKSKHLTDRDMELSAAYNERDSLMKEVQRLQLSMNESMTQTLHADTGRDANSINMLKEMEDEVKLQRDSNANLMLQLKKSQESNLELVAILEELEDTLEKTKQQVNQDMEMSAACSECDSLKQEVERLQLELEEAMTGKTHVESTSNDSVRVLKELEDEINFQKETNANLMLQLKKSQESSLELVEVLQELEETVEKSKNLMDLDTELSAACSERDSLKQEVERLQLALEESMTEKMTEKTHADYKSETSVHMLKELEDEINFQKQTNANLMLQLKKSQESSIELVAILQELEETAEKSKNLMDLDMELSAAYSERDSLKQEVERLQLELEESMEKQTHTNTSNGQDSVNTLEAEVNFQKETNVNLTLQLKKSQESNLELIAILQELEDTVEKQALEIANLTEKNNDSKDENVENKILLGNEVEWERRISIKEQEIARLEEKLSSMLDSQPMSELAHNGSHFDLIKENESLRAKIQELERDCLELTDENVDLIYKLKELSGDNDSRGSPSSELMSNILHHNFEPVLQSKTDEPKEMLEKKEALGEPSSAMPRNLETEKKEDLQHYKDEASDLQLKLRRTQLELEEKKIELSELKKTTGSAQDPEIQIYIEELARSKASFEEMKSHLVLTEQEINSLMSSKQEQENIILSLQKEKSQLEDNLSVLNRESSVTSKTFEDVQHDLIVLTSSLDSQISANKALEEKSLKLESHIKELDLQIYELEQEKVQLSKGIAALQDELKCFENDKESNRLELEDSKLLISSMKVETERYKDEMEMQKVDLEQKLHEAQKQISESQMESDTLKQANSKLQVTIESLDEEYSSLQRLSDDLKRQKLELHEHVTHLEVELEQTQSKSLGYFKNVELLEQELSSLQIKTSSNEKLFLLQIDQMIEEHKEQEEKITQAHSMLQKMESEKRIEVENLLRENAQLVAQMSSTHDEREKIASDAILEASILRSDKAKLEFNLNEANAKIESYETDVQTLRQEYRVQIDGLVELLNASKHSEEILMADIQDMKRQVKDAKNGEENSRNLASELEIKLKTTDYEKQQITEEISVLKIQLEKISKLQDEILVLKGSLDEEKFDKEKLGGLLRSSSEECEQLKMERDSLIKKLTSMQEVLETEKDDKQDQIALQGQRLGIENDLSSKEASTDYEAEIINELNEIKRVNSDYQKKIQRLEGEKQELTKKAELIEEELMMAKDANDYEKNSKVNAKLHIEKEEPRGSEIDRESKIHILEQKLAEALETNNVYKEQLDKLVTEKDQTDDAEVSKSIQDENETSSGNKDKVSSLEAELKEVKERYLYMSLQYAEVQAEREELVLQLKSSAKKEKRWFS